MNFPKLKVKVIGLIVIASAATGIAEVAKYSGIYNLDGGFPIVMAITKGGHLLTMSDDSNIKDQLNPEKSTVNETGKVVASTKTGVSLVAQIKSDFSFSGTAKDGGKTIRIVGERVLK